MGGLIDSDRIVITDPPRVICGQGANPGTRTYRKTMPAVIIKPNKSTPEPKGTARENESRYRKPTENKYV